MNALSMIALVTLAQDAQPLAPSAWEVLVSWLFSSGGLVTLIGVLGAVAGIVFGTTAVRRRRVALAIYHAFHVVEDLDVEMADTKLDKVVEGLKAADAWMVANGWRALKPGEQEVAKLGFKSLNGQAEAAVDIQVKAAELAAPSPT